MVFAEILKFEFVQRALVTGLLIGFSCSLLGVFLVLRRLSLIGDGLAHVTFGSVAAVILLGFSPLYVTLAALPLVVLSSLAILHLTRSRRIHGDAAIGIVSSVGIALGVIMASVSGGYNADLLSYLFGNILTATQAELFLSLFIFCAVILFVIFFYPGLFALTFDEELAKSIGVKTNLINIILMALTAAAVVSAMKIAGIMLVSALLILPPVTALQLSLTFKKTLITSALVAVFSVAGGMLFSFVFNMPSGATIVIFNALFLFVVLLTKKVIQARR